MPEYQVLARRYRPQCFRDVLGQDAIVTTLKNMIRLKRTAHAYLFCGGKGTGKTTLARLFAKALNCHALTAEGEPCNVCSSCRDIVNGHSLDILEIDGASNRGIDDVRKLNETIGYVPAGGRYKIYIIDEVHMLTKEAFNALLKTLEEPPPSVKFFFATTEPHKVLPTILSRCQRFNLNRIPPEMITKKLQTIARDLSIDVETEALQMIADRADGALRDAESLFDQVLAFHEGPITAHSLASALGLVPREIYFQLDEAGARADFAHAFEISANLFSQGKDLMQVVEGLMSHLRTLLFVQVSKQEIPNRQRYEQSTALYSRHQLLDLLDYLVEAQSRLRFSPSSRIALETLLLHVLRSHQRLSIDVLVKKLTELESKLTPPQPQETPAPPLLSSPPSRVSEDPTPRPEDLEKTNPEELARRRARQDTLLQFSSVELQGTLERNPRTKG